MSVGFGTWRSSESPFENVLSALTFGYKMIDCSPLYQNQIKIGEAINTFLQQNHLSRNELFIVSKLWNTNHKPEFVEEDCKQTLKELGLEYLDLFLVHWPVAFAHVGDNMFPKDQNGNALLEDVKIEDTWKEMEKLVTKGLVKEIGVSNFTIQMMEDMKKYASILPTTNQVESHVYFQQNEMHEYLKLNNMKFMAYCPLGNSYPDKFPSPLNDITIKDLALSRNVNPSTICLSFLVQRGCIPLPRSSNPGRILDNLKTITLTSEEMQTIQKLDKNERHCFPDFMKHICLQLVERTRSKQITLWIEFISSFLKFHRKTIIDIATDATSELFYNRKIDRKLKIESIQFVLSEMMAQGYGSWMVPQKQCCVTWRKTEEWAGMVLQYIQEQNITSICTVYELRKGFSSSNNEFDVVETYLFLQILNVLEKNGKVITIKSDIPDEIGVKFV